MTSARKHILVAGGAGFVGSHLCESLLKKGHEVLCADNLLTGRQENIHHLLTDPNFKFIRHDITTPLVVDQPLNFILHLASPASPKDYQQYPVETLKAGSLGTLNLLELAKVKQARFLLASTSEIYGDPKVHPQTEDYWGNVNPIGPRSCYDEAKRFAESLTMTYHRFYGVETRIARIFNTYGPRMRLNDGRALPAFLTQALEEREVTVFGDGSQTRSFCYVEDMVEGLSKLLFSNEISPVNLGNPCEISLNDFARMALRLVKSKSKIIYHPLPVDDPKVRRPDITKAKRVLGWEPTVDLERGLQQTIPYFVEQLTRQGLKIS